MDDRLENEATIDPSKSSWFSWIPTNIGYLNFNYIADEKSLITVFGKDNFILETSSNKEKKVKLLNTNLSDLNTAAKKLLKKNEIPSVTPNGNVVEFDYGELNIKDNYKTNEGDASSLTTLYNNCLFELLFQGGIPYEMSLISRITSDIGSRYEFNTLYLSYGKFTNENYHNKLKLNMVNNKVPTFHSVEEFQKYMNEYNEYLGIIYPELKKSIQKIMDNYRI